MLVHIISAQARVFRYMSTNGIARVKGFHASTFCDIACTSLPFHQWCGRVSVAPHLCHLLSFICLFLLSAVLAVNPLVCVFWSAYARVSLNIYPGTELAAQFYFRYLCKNIHLWPPHIISIFSFNSNCMFGFNSKLFFFYHASYCFLWFDKVPFSSFL